MKKKLENRTQYKKSFIDFDKSPIDPINLFEDWIDKAGEESGGQEVNCFTLSTSNSEGEVKNRIVLLRDFRPEGFVFYTNYGSRKSRDIEENKKVCASFFWNFMERQVIISGEASKLTERESKEYFSSRPLESKIGAWASNQSEELLSRTDLEEKYSFYKKKFQDKEIPLPPNWGGFIIKPFTVEFWQGREHRLHDRLSYQKESEKWKKILLNP